MTENPFPRLDADLLRLSRDVEEAHRILTIPHDYSPDDIEDAKKIIEETSKTFLETLNFEIGVETTRINQVLESVMLGLYHYKGKLLLPNKENSN